VVLAVALGGVLLSACSNSVHVSVVGDSITYDSGPAIINTLSPNYAVGVNGAPGYTIGGQLPTIEAVANHGSPPPQDWIFNLGTDDAIQTSHGHATGWKTDLAQALRLMNYDSSCVVLVTIGDNADSYGGGAGTVAVQINAALKQAAAANPAKVKIIDWAALVVQNPGWLQLDGIHPNALGQQELAHLYQVALQSCP
jgi:lysophospholipase L1-like esterase